MINSYRFIFLSLLFFGCAQLSREDQLQAECETNRRNGYLYMIPILQRHTTSGATETNSLVWVGNTEIGYRKCSSEAKKNQWNLRSN
ncbi:Hypothetical lipoprotein [Leptospira biflexa serovar Patoc strain 'Patoc 1 (Ames)']|uniref:Lipoprotein n=1 Tax=Leptospira biflexa serovar Patoc (strain Patoc 1 / ATCC 23582 / Paris) TaxID=456481 RepID=B0STM4_LEPBP|nr:Hypothetical lipoprotein [Leptospira biflexa serovar Patoc strain 'Patoc 1 (Ames)']ABZ99558.1 Hypothetical protein; putative signal peptide [Leptospira biflexa serovar Patoc strain 'Patoc 1 (Paris)']TGM51716.1 hypothetical protein EHQ91_17040 [Leptospira biflexa]